MRCKKIFPVALILFLSCLLSLTGCGAGGLTGGPVIVSQMGSIHFGSIGATRVIVGEVRNTGDTALRFIKIEATHFTGEGKVHATSHAYVITKGLLPGEKAPFAFIEATSAGAMKFNLEIISFKETDIQPYRDFEVIEQESSISYMDLYTIVGSFKNIGTSSAVGPTIAATCYSNEGEVIGVGWQTKGQLEPGETTDFDVWVYPWASAEEIDDCTLQIEAEVSGD